MSRQVEVTVGRFGPTTMLGALPDEVVDDVARRWRRQHYRSGALILGADDPSNDLYFLLQGCVRAVLYTSGGREVTFRDLRPGECFGEIAALDGGPRTANVVARGPVEIARVPARELDALLEANPPLARALLTVLARKLRADSQRLADYTALTGPQRVVAELLAQGRQFRTGMDAAHIPDPPTQTQFATLVFTTRETVAREASLLRRRGLLSWTRRAIVIPSLTRLEAEAAREQE